MDLEQTAQKILELRKSRVETIEKRNQRLKETEKPYNQRVSDMDQETRDLSFEVVDVENYLAEHDFQKVDSLPWYLDVTRGVSKRLKDNPTYWMGTETPEGKREGLVFKVSGGNYYLYRSEMNKRNANVLSADRKRNDEAMLVCAIGALGGAIMGTTLLALGVEQNNPSYNTLGVCGIGIAFGVMGKLIYSSPKRSLLQSQGNDAVLELYQRFSRERGEK